MVIQGLVVNKASEAIYEEYQSFTIGQQVVAQLPWSHNVVFLAKPLVKEECRWCVGQIIKTSTIKLHLLHKYLKQGLRFFKEFVSSLKGKYFKRL